MHVITINAKRGHKLEREQGGVCERLWKNEKEKSNNNKSDRLILEFEVRIVVAPEARVEILSFDSKS